MSVVLLLSSDMENSGGQIQMVVSPLSFGGSVRSRSRSWGGPVGGLWGRGSLLSVLTLIHSAESTSVTQQTVKTAEFETWFYDGEESDVDQRFTDKPDSGFWTKTCVPHLIWCVFNVDGT